MSRPEKGLRAGSNIPSFALRDTEGNLVHANDLLGKTTALYFLRGTW